MTEQNVALTLWALATMGRTPETRVLEVLEQRVENISGVSVCAFVLVKQVRGVDICTFLLVKQVNCKASKLRGLAGTAVTFCPQGVSNTMWAFATMGRNPGEGFFCFLFLVLVFCAVYLLYWYKSTNTDTSAA